MSRPTRPEGNERARTGGQLQTAARTLFLILRGAEGAL